MTIELPSWAWLVLTAVNASGFTIIVKMLAYYGAKADHRLEVVEKRQGKLETRVSVLEVRVK